MQELIMVLLLFGIFASVMIVKAQDKNLAYGKIILAVILPLLVNFLSPLAAYFISSYRLLAVYDLIRWVLLSALHIWACCFIYKTITKSTHSPIHIWAKEFRIWNVVSCIAMVLGICVILAECHFAAESIAHFETLTQEDLSIVNTLLGYDKYDLIIRTLSKARLLLEAIVIGSMMLPALLHKQSAQPTTK